MIICAALRIDKLVICGVRHADCYEILHKFNVAYDKGKVEEGFVTQENIFLDRKEAFIQAKSFGQISSSLYYQKIDKKEYELYSEDLY